MKRLQLNIKGMHCASCEVLIERKFQKISGVTQVKAHQPSGKAEVHCSCDIPLDTFQNAIKEHGYTISPSDISSSRNKREYLEIGAIFLIVVGIFLLFRQFDLLPKGWGISSQMTIGVVLLMGVVASLSTCLAVTGGLLLAVATKYHERHPEQKGYQRFIPHLSFNLGRMMSYTLLGGVLGGIGSFFTISPRITGFLTILVSIIMVILGFQLLHLFPWLHRFHFKMPKFFAHKIYDASSHTSQKGTPFLFGASTFFLPCGFTQALQLYVLSQGKIIEGALIMLAFSLGTLPMLLSLGALTGFTKGTFHRYFVKFAGVVVILIAIFNMNNGLVIAGSSFDMRSLFNANGAAGISSQHTPAKIIDGKQIVSMQVTGLEYSPSQFTVVEDIPVEWQIDGTKASGCAQVITVPQLDITEYLPRDQIKTITFTPTEQGRIHFHCSMGMTTKGASFTVVSNQNI